MSKCNFLLVETLSIADNFISFRFFSFQTEEDIKLKEDLEMLMQRLNV